LKTRGKVYGPYAGVEGVPMKLGGSDRRVFTDRFNNVIRYYVHEGGSYDETDNADPPGNFSAYVKDGDDNYFRTDFLLMAEGADQQWDDPTDRTDDVTNFSN
jgi:hypothetical protein